MLVNCLLLLTFLGNLFIILYKVAFHGSNNAMNVVWLTLVIDDSDALQRRSIAIHYDWNRLIFWRRLYALNINFIIVRGTDNRNVMLHPDACNFALVSVNGRSTLFHGFAVEKKYFTCRSANSYWVAVHCNGRDGIQLVIIVLVLQIKYLPRA